MLKSLKILFASTLVILALSFAMPGNTINAAEKSIQEDCYPLCNLQAIQDGQIASEIGEDPSETLLASYKPAISEAPAIQASALPQSGAKENLLILSLFIVISMYISLFVLTDKKVHSRVRVINQKFLRIFK